MRERVKSIKQIKRALERKWKIYHWGRRAFKSGAKRSRRPGRLRARGGRR